MSDSVIVPVRPNTTLINVLYAMHTVAPFTLWMLSAVALIVQYVQRGDEQDAVHRAHHDYMIATFWWTLLWLVLTSPLWLLALTFILAFIPALAWLAIGVWYMFRFIRGWIRFNDYRLPKP